MFAAKGAPEAIFRICRLQRQVEQQMLAVVDAACGCCFRDPVRDGVRDALAIAHQAGISVAMITGDYPATALAIADEAGISIKAGVLTGREIAEMEPALLPERCKTVRVFARVMPEQSWRWWRRSRRAG